MFRKISLSAAVLASTVMWAAPASALVTTTIPVDSTPPLEGPFVAVADPGTGVITGTINIIHNFTDDFQDTFTFTLPDNGTGSGSITTSAGATVNLGLAGDLDFTSVTINGATVPITRTPSDILDVVEVAATFDVPLTAGVLNQLVVNGHSNGPSSYGGQITFIPTPSVPEPATWAMMLIGFGAVGFAMRRQKKGMPIAAAA